MEITGRITGNAQVATTKNGREVVNFSIAINDRYKPKGQSEAVKIVTYINCTYWNNTGVAVYLTKGTIVELFGRIGVNVWKNMDGDAKGTLTMHVQQLKLFSAGNQKQEQEPVKQNERGVEDATEDLPF